MVVVKNGTREKKRFCTSSFSRITGTCTIANTTSATYKPNRIQSLFPLLSTNDEGEKLKGNRISSSDMCIFFVSYPLVSKKNFIITIDIKFGFSSKINILTSHNLMQKSNISSWYNSVS